MHLEGLIMNKKNIKKVVLAYSGGLCLLYTSDAADEL